MNFNFMIVIKKISIAILIYKIKILHILIFSISTYFYAESINLFEYSFNN